ncbi:MAG: glycosyltransferase family 4 protein [Paludibacteraceae bacterium]
MEKKRLNSNNIRKRVIGHTALNLEQSSSDSRFSIPSTETRNPKPETQNSELRVLFVCSKNSGRVVPFIAEQAESIRRLGYTVVFFTIEGKGIAGYLKNYSSFRKKVKDFSPDIIHAHYGLSCLFANMQRKVPVVSTYHGSDINNKRVFCLSKIAIKLSKLNIFVSEKTRNIATPLISLNKERKRKNVLIPCGVDTELFVPMDKLDARKRLALNPEGKYVLFAGAFDNEVKNPALALASVGLLANVDLIELKGYSREEVVRLMNAVDVCLMTSHTEGSPQFIKEAMACNCPVVSVPVGDVPEVLRDVEGCFLVDYDAKQVASQLQKALIFGDRTQGRAVIEERKLGLMQVAERIGEVYGEVIVYSL